jgi:hypothetical protein
VIAAQHRKVATHRGKRAALDVFHPRAEVADGHIVLGFARNSTGVATDAAIVINEKAILHGGLVYRGSKIIAATQKVERASRPRVICSSKV